MMSNLLNRLKPTARSDEAIRQSTSLTMAYLLERNRKFELFLTRKLEKLEALVAAQEARRDVLNEDDPMLEGATPTEASPDAEEEDFVIDALELPADSWLGPAPIDLAPVEAPSAENTQDATRNTTPTVLNSATITEPPPTTDDEPPTDWMSAFGLTEPDTQDSAEANSDDAVSESEDDSDETTWDTTLSDSAVEDWA